MIKVHIYMNFFYGINNDLFKSEVQIPLFQNNNFEKSNLDTIKNKLGIILLNRLI